MDGLQHVKNKNELLNLLYTLRQSTPINNNNINHSNNNNNNNINNNNNNNKNKKFATEEDLIRAVIFSFQGIDSDYLFYNKNESKFFVPPNIYGYFIYSIYLFILFINVMKVYRMQQKIYFLDCKQANIILIPYIIYIYIYIFIYYIDAS
jgi:hypothetical protein